MSLLRELPSVLLLAKLWGEVTLNPFHSAFPFEIVHLLGVGLSCAHFCCLGSGWGAWPSRFPDVAKWVGFESGKVNWICKMNTLYSVVLQGLLWQASERSLGVGHFYVSPPPPNSYVKILMPDVMVFGSGAHERWSQHEGRALRMGFVPFSETPHSVLGPFCHARAGTVRRHRLWIRKRSPDTTSASTMSLNSQPPELWGINICCL